MFRENSSMKIFFSITASVKIIRMVFETEKSPVPAMSEKVESCTMDLSGMMIPMEMDVSNMSTIFCSSRVLYMGAEKSAEKKRLKKAIVLPPERSRVRFSMTRYEDLSGIKRKQIRISSIMQPKRKHMKKSVSSACVFSN